MTKRKLNNLFGLLGSKEDDAPEAPKSASVDPLALDAALPSGDETSDLVGGMLAEGRFALLLRPQIAANLTNELRQLAQERLDDWMGIVPDGDVLLQSWRAEREKDSDEDHKHERLVHVDPLYMDRFQVSNRDYKRFVDGGGYEQIQLWDQAIWPAVLDFVDKTGHPGPRFWRDGCYAAGEEKFPVVGVSWYEASAYARWVGKRLPSDPEWVKSGAWPVLAQGSKPVQRRYPWGDAMDRAVCRLWNADEPGPAPVDNYGDGVSVGGLYQLIGNVWEWTTSQFGAWDATGRRMDLESPMKSIRGGAHDTYFDCQATCQFQSGESPLARKHNIGFRCALSMCDVVAFDVNGELEEHDESDLAVCGTTPEEEVV